MRTGCWVVALGLSALLSGRADVPGLTRESPRVREIAALLPPKAGVPGPLPSDRAAWSKLAGLPETPRILASAAEEAAQPVPELPESLYREFSRTGVHRPFDTLFLLRIHRLSLFTLAEALENRGRFLPDIRRYLEAVVAERTWTMPAHDLHSVCYDKGRPWVKLFTTQRALVVAYAVAWFGDSLPPELVAAARKRCRDRVVDPYLAICRDRRRTREFGCDWFDWGGNWNAVCHAGCVMATLLLVDDPLDRATAIAGAEEGTRAYLRSFPSDGSCSEGIAYWDYGFGSYAALALAVRDATGGRLRLHGDNPVLPKVAAFGHDFQLQDGVAPAFADGDGIPERAVMAMGRVLAPDALPAALSSFSPLAGFSENYGPFAQPCHVVALRAFVEGAPVAGASADELPTRTYYPQAQVLIGRDAERRFAVAVKGGHNKELHNHNDVGSYSVALDGVLIAGDVGHEQYGARTFSPRRYESKVLGSYGHPVPRIGGLQQPEGAQYRARVLSTDFASDRDEIRLDLKACYPTNALSKLERTVVFDRKDGSFTVRDDVAFARPTSLDVPTVTVAEATRAGDGWVFMREGRRLGVSVEVSGGRWRWEEDVFVNPNLNRPRRIAVAFDEPVAQACVTFRFRPLPSVPASGEIAVKDCFARWDATSLTVGNAAFSRTYVASGTDLKTRSLVSGGVEWIDAARLGPTGDVLIKVDCPLLA